MRKVLPLVFVAAMLPVGVAANRGPGAVVPQRANAVPFQPTGERKIPEAQAKSSAVERVRGDLDAGKLGAWGDPHVRGNLAATRTLFNPTGGKSGGAIYVVMVGGGPQAKGQVRVVVDAATGAIVSSTHRDFGGVAPDWWLQGLNSPPPARR